MQTKDDVLRIIDAYDVLVFRAIDIAGKPPVNASVNDDSLPRLSIEDDNMVLTWKEYESDYYGSGYCTDEDARFPLRYLSMTDEQLDALRKQIRQEEREREAKVRTAEAAVARDRAEAHDRAEWARLRQKFGTKV